MKSRISSLLNFLAKTPASSTLKTSGS
ncbi:hypothetical protein [Pyrococcus sp. NA2]